MGSIIMLIVGIVIPVTLFVVIDYEKTMKELETLDDPK